MQLRLPGIHDSIFPQLNKCFCGFVFCYFSTRTSCFAGALTTSYRVGKMCVVLRGGLYNLDNYEQWSRSLQRLREMVQKT